jgi:hypothetical protein
MRLRSALVSRVAAASSALAVLAVLSVRPARADDPPPPAERARVYSSYEAATIAEVLASLGATEDPAPEGKTVERVDIVPLDVFEQLDPFPLWAKSGANFLHSTSRRSVIRRELLFGERDPYRQVLVDETLRNLRRLPQLSLLVITKDVWSLRLNWNATYTSGGLELFDAQPAEWNFLGTHQILNGHFQYQPLSYVFGVGYTVPRLGDSRIATVVSADVIVNHDSGKAEGSLGSVIAGQPLYSALVPWAWDASVAWEDAILRRYINARLARYVAPTGGSLPVQYNARLYTTTYEATRSFGWDVKHDVSFGAGIAMSRYTTSFPGADPATVADFDTANVPLSDTRVGPYVQYHGYRKRFVRVIDFDTLALQEDYSLGHDVVFRVYPSFHALGATRDVLGLYGAVQYTVSVRDGLFRASFASRTEPEVDRIADASVQPTIHFVSPTVARLGRIVLDATTLYRWRNYLNAKTILGGDDRLRGYPTNFFQGTNYVSYNVELRSRPIDILSCAIAAVGFFDAGTAWDDEHNFTLHEALGFGVRALFPWLDRVVFRADLGFPLDRPLPLDATGTPIPPFAFLVSFSQAFPTPNVAPAPVLPTGQ